MAQAGIIQAMSGSVIARTPQGEVRELKVGDIVYENESIETANGAHATISNMDGNVIDLAENSKVLLDETVTGKVDAADAIIHEVENLQNALAAGEDISEAEQDTAIGEEEDAFEYDTGYYEGDSSAGQVGSYLIDVDSDSDGQTFDPFIIDETNTDNAQGGGDTDNDISAVTDADTAANTVSENAAIGTEVKLTGLATDADAGDVVSYSLTDDSDGMFVIDPDTGVVTVAGNLDYETAVSHDVEITATSTDGSTSAKTFTIDVTNVNDTPVAVDDPVFVMGGLKSEYYGVDVQLNNIAQVEGIVSSDDPDATFISTRINYGYIDKNSDGDYDKGVDTVMSGSLSDGLTIDMDKNVTDSNLMDFIKGDSGSLVYNSGEVANGNAVNATDGILHITGMINIAETGNYTFQVNHDDGFDIRIDGKSVFDFDGNVSPRHSVESITLESGLHDVEILYWDQGGNYIFDLELVNSDGVNVWVPENLSYPESSAISVSQDSTITIDLDNNDYDVEGTIDSASITITTDPQHGAVTVHSDGTVTYDPEDGYSGVDTFAYTIADNEGAVSDPATVTMNVSSRLVAVDDINSVEESGLATGTDPDVTAITAAGNLFENDSNADSGTVTSVDGNTPVDGTITVNTANGILEVDTQTGGYKYNLTSPTTDVDGELEQEQFNYTVTNSNGDTSSASLAITIEDDQVEATGQSMQIELGSTTTNLIIIADTSGSMRGEINLERQAIETLVKEYGNLGDVNVNLTTFSSDAVNSGWQKDVDTENYNAALPEAYGGTDYYDALTAAMTNAQDYPPQATQTVVYFMSDGAMTWSKDDFWKDASGDGDRYSDTLSAWKTFIDDNATKLFVFDMGGNGGDDLAAVALQADDYNSDSYKNRIPTSTDKSGDVVVVDDMGDLQNHMVLTVGYYGNVITSGASASGATVEYGADGGSITAITIGAETYHYDGSQITDSDGDVIAATSQLAGVSTTIDGVSFTLDFESGEYTYNVDSTVSQEHHSETFDVTFTDGDGDISNGPLNFYIDPESANIITAQTSGNINGTDSDEVIYGTAVDDVINGEGGSDIIHADGGNDTIVFDAGDSYIDGGEGMDTLLMSNNNLDFSNLPDLKIDNVEKLALNSSEAQQVTLTLDDVLDMSGSDHVLQVTGGEGDEIILDVKGSTSDWTPSPDGIFTNGTDHVQIVSIDDADNKIKIFTDDGNPIG